LQEYEFQAEIGKLMAMFRIGHTQAGYLFAGPNHSGKRLFPAIPVEFYMYSDGLYIKSIHEKYAPLSGAKILKLGDMTINEALDKIRPFVNYENEWGFLSNLPFYLRFPKLLKVAGISAEMDKLIIQYEKNGVVKEPSFQLKKLNH
jgi:hypothetical protein